MIKILTSATLACTLALAGCGGNLDINKISAIQAEIQADANLVCGFVPTIATIASFIPGVGDAAMSAGSIAQAICQAVQAAPRPQVHSARLKSMKAGSRLGTPVSVGTVYVPGKGDVSITGTFTR